MKRIALTRLPELLSAMAQGRTVYCPGEDRFAPWDGQTLPSLAGQSRLGPKELFFPQVEQLAQFRVSGKSLEILEAELLAEPFVVFGLRGCDCRALEILDRVFLAEPVDTFYEARRRHGTLVSLACTQPEETCFCHTFGIDFAEPQGDVTAWPVEGFLYLRANTEKGEALLAGLPLEDGPEEPVTQLQAALRALAERLPLHDLSTRGFGEPDKTLEWFHRPEWESLSRSCLGCGACTFVCPTCQCYDVKEFDTGHEVRRFRCWDSCMYSDFTLMSAGQPRPTQKERFRQRFMHKLQYFPANNDGIFGCVGCGRCLRQCPIHMNIVKVMKTLGGASNA